MRPALALVLACQLACTSSSELVPAALVFPPTSVGHPVEVALPTLSDGTPLATWRIGRPFEIDVLPLSGGKDGKLRFRAEQPGVVEARLVGVQGGRTYEVPVRAEAEANTTCRRKEECNDGLDCTDDSCASALCVHAPRHERCPGATSACQTARCDAGKGCVLDNVPDGISCSITAEDGCRATTTCRQGTCEPRSRDERPCTGAAPVALAPLWTYAVPAESSSDASLSRSLLPTVASDELLTTVLVECRFGRGGPFDCVLLSLDADGRERHRTPIDPPLSDKRNVLARVGDLVVLGATLKNPPGSETYSSPGLEGRRWDDGSRAWVRRIREDYLPEVESEQAADLGAPLVRLSGTELLVQAEVWSGWMDHANVPLRIDGRTGALLARHPPDALPHWTLPASNGAGELFLRQDRAVAALDAALAPRWERTLGAELPGLHGQDDGLVVDGDTLLVGGGPVLEAGSGAPIAPALTLPSGDLRQAQGRLWSVSTNPDWQRRCAPVRVDTALARTDASSERCTLPAASARGAAVLTARGSLLVITSNDARSAQLSEIAPGGRVLQAATLPSGAMEIAGLRAGRILVADEHGLSAYDLPEAVDLAPSGWVAEGGSFARDGVPR